MLTMATTSAQSQLDEVLRETDLLPFRTKLNDDLQLTRIEHFDNVTDTELQQLAGLSVPAIR